MLKVKGSRDEPMGTEYPVASCGSYTLLEKSI